MILLIVEMSLWAVSGTWKQIEMNGRVNGGVVREMGPSRPHSRGG